jgi:hypothetical protein
MLPTGLSREGRMDHPRPGLKYVTVDELDKSKTTLEHFKVVDSAGEQLGKLEGFIINTPQALPYYLVVNAGGWFHSKHVLIPVGHAALDLESRTITADVPKDRVKRFPGFDLQKFATMTAQELDRMAADIAQVCCPDEVVELDELFEHFRTPIWWQVDYYKVEGFDQTPESVAGRKR